MDGQNGNGPLKPFVHQVDGESVRNKKVVNVDSSKLTNGHGKESYRAYSTVFAPAAPGSKFKDIHQQPSGRVVAAEGPTKQTWVNFGDARRAQHYVATYSGQIIKSDLKQTYGIAQEAAAVAKMMQARREKRGGQADGYSSVKTTVRAHEVQKTRGQYTPKDSTLFNTASVQTRGVIAEQRMGSWGDAGPVIRGFDVDKNTTNEVLGASVVEEDKKKLRSEIINVDQTKAANQIGISGRAKQHLFKGIQPNSLGSVVFAPQNMSPRFQATAGQVSSLSQFEQQHKLPSTVSVVANLRDTHEPKLNPRATEVVQVRSKPSKKR
ncbi:hypothetical protein [Alteromonas sp. a30]|uniref:hypothetical protein n=1 Tax=Alteromonas sp. a30 TaxID=2730917 RepID=UPI00227F034A|nr:hypothetical protein [Alteromonas sp. a30]MCY7295513.1 hypothetical protein [Alteromonas sp. a30]